MVSLLCRHPSRFGSGAVEPFHPSFCLLHHSDSSGPRVGVASSAESKVAPESCCMCSQFAAGAELTSHVPSGYRSHPLEVVCICVLRAAYQSVGSFLLHVLSALHSASALPEGRTVLSSAINNLYQSRVHARAELSTKTH